MPEENENNLITVSCPECGEKTFTFSKNILDEDDGIQFICPNACGIVKVCYTTLEHNILVQILQ